MKIGRNTRVLFRVLVCDSRPEVYKTGCGSGATGSDIGLYYVLQTAICFLFQGS